MVVSLHVQSFLPLAEAAQAAVSMVRNLQLLLTTDNMEVKGRFDRRNAWRQGRSSMFKKTKLYVKCKSLDLSGQVEVLL